MISPYPGHGYGLLQNSQKIRVRVWTSYSTQYVSGTGMNLLKNMKKCSGMVFFPYRTY